MEKSEAIKIIKNLISDDLILETMINNKKAYRKIEYFLFKHSNKILIFLLSYSSFFLFGLFNFTSSLKEISETVGSVFDLWMAISLIMLVSTPYSLLLKFMFFMDDSDYILETPKEIRKIEKENKMNFKLLDTALSLNIYKKLAESVDEKTLSEILELKLTYNDLNTKEIILNNKNYVFLKEKDAALKREEAENKMQLKIDNNKRKSKNLAHVLVKEKNNS